jgi:hypothetical protein
VKIRKVGNPVVFFVGDFLAKIKSNVFFWVKLSLCQFSKSSKKVELIEIDATLDVEPLKKSLNDFFKSMIIEGKKCIP